MGTIMSLAVDDRHGGRSRSRSRDRRSRDEPPRDRDPVATYADVREPSYIYPEDDLDDRYAPTGRRRGEPSSQTSASGLPYPADGGMDSMLPGATAGLYSYDDTRPVYRTASPPRDTSFRSSKSNLDGHIPGSFPDDDRRSKRDSDDDNRRVRYAEPPRGDAKYDSRSRRDRSDDDEPRVRYAEPPSSRDKHRGGSDLSDDKLKFLPQKYTRGYGDKNGGGNDDDRYAARGRDKTADRRSKKERDEDDLAYGRPPMPKPSRADSPPTYGSYISGSQLSDKRSSKYGREDDDDRRDRRRTSPPEDAYGSRRSHHESSYRDDPRSSGASILTAEPSDRDRDRRRDKSPGPSVLTAEPSARDRDRRRDKSPGPSALTVEPASRERDRSRDRRDKSPGPSVLTVEPGRDRERSRDRRGGTRDKSPQPPTARMSSLTVDTARSSNLSLAAAPASPLLESYHGTYQDCSPMPSPLLLASGHDDARVIEALSPIGSDVEGDSKKKSRRARFHDPEDIATTLAGALRGDRKPNVEPLVEILPSLTHEQVMELRVEYKRIVKTGSDRKGVNVAKHIRARLKDEDPNLMKACYSVALGKWESEAYWANFWYQGDKTRRELLIESLMGRSNYEIHQIKEAFTDKKYDNSIVKCMKTELKEDKFKKAVLLVLDERRMEDLDPYGRRLPIDYKLVDQDVADLRRAVKADKGGESAMIGIVVKRSDGHLREVLKEYEHHYRANFAREALKKSGNLVGELLAHILNGIINRPVRDALLLHHALTASRKDDLRRELLISRLVRFHWDAAHMQAVRRAYRERYARDLSDAVRDATSGLWGRFCVELCIARMPNDVRRFERVDVIR
ncbi:annexin ANXC4 [Purpureocillium lavendulum]|uniref:Annexin ANXC4 n=1 Tax=Purpureocillium lavendulum TaxID=1247861 RepID=A0AB34FWX5_9HYPO|nr:annexin ANXC4 [Purpureocillium lavendulum]